MRGTIGKGPAGFKPRIGRNGAQALPVAGMSLHPSADRKPILDGYGHRRRDRDPAPLTALDRLFIRPKFQAEAALRQLKEMLESRVVPSP
jgi:hypothetical protein